MKRKILIGILSALAVILLLGCGIPQEDYDAVVAGRDAAVAGRDAAVAERDAALDEVASLEGEVVELEEALLAAKEVPEAPLSFEAVEYVNTDYGFSVMYPIEWSVYPAEALTEPVMFLAGLGSWYTPVIEVGIVDVAEADTIAEIVPLIAQDPAAYAVFEGNSYLADGTPVIVARAKSDYAGMTVESYILAVKKDSKWIVVLAGTIETFGAYDEILYPEIAHTLKFE